MTERRNTSRDVGRPPVEPGPSPELIVALVLHRVRGGGVVTLGGVYLDDGLPAPGSLTGAFDELLGTGLLAVADPDPHGRRVTLTTAGHTRYEQLHPTPRPPVPATRFPSPTPAGRRLISSPAPHPDPGGRPEGSGGGPPRWAHCADDGRRHLLAPTEVAFAISVGHGEALCGRFLPAAGLTLAHGSSGALCIACLAGITPGHQQRSHLDTQKATDASDTTATPRERSGDLHHTTAHRGGGGTAPAD